jgi:putative ABC transport system ATP-binding protein
MNRPDPVIAVEKVNHWYGVGALRKQVLFDVSIDVLPGEIVILTGPSGSGKTTLLTLCGALRTVVDGSVRIFRTELRGAAGDVLVRTRESIGFIFQAHNLLAALTARQNVALSLGLDASLTNRERAKKAAQMLEEVGLGNRIDYYPEHLSGGQKQRVAVARALVRAPEIILADEPTASLDRKAGREVIELLNKIARQQGCAILLVTHDNRILDIADRIVTLEDGRLMSFAAGLAANTGNLLAAFARLQHKGELKRHLREVSRKQFVEILEQMTSEFEQYLRVLEVGSQEAVQSIFNNVLEAVSYKMVALLNADRGSLFLVDRAKGTMRSRIAHSGGDQPLEIEVAIDKSVAGQVVLTGQLLNINDPYNYPHFNPEVDRKTGYQTQSILCLPIYDRRNQIFAVAQLLNKQGGPAFTREDEESFRSFAEPLGVILETCKQLADRAPQLGPS